MKRTMRSPRRGPAPSTVLLWPMLLALLTLAGCDDGDGSAAGDAMSPDGTVSDTSVMDMASDMASEMASDMTPDAAAFDAAPPDMAPDLAIAPPRELPPRGECDASRPPAIMAHGLLAAGDTWAAHVARFAANGYCPDRYHAFDWNTLDMNTDHAADLDAFVDAVRARHGVEQVHLMGHSAGGRLGYEYLADGARAAKVEAYVHVGSFPDEAPPGPPDMPVRTLNVWSDGDLIVPGADIPGAENVMLPGVDHYAVATEDAAFEAVHTFLYGAPPATVERPPADVPIVSGRALTLGENRVEVGATVDVWALDPESGQRLNAGPEARFFTDDEGRWGPFAAERDVPYELHVRPAGGGTPVRYYRPPFVGDDPLVYLRTLPGPGSTAGLILTQVPFTAETSVMVVFSSTRALTFGVDDLRIDGASVLTEALAPAAETLIALFVYDQGRDGEPGAENPIFGQFPFLQMLDLPLAADPAVSVELRLGEQVVRMPRLPADPEGALIAVFDPTR